MRNSEIERLKYDPLALQYLLLRISALGHPDELSHLWGQNFFVFRRDKHSGNANELEFDQRNDTFGEESINDIDGNPKRLGKHVVLEVNLYEPVDKRLPHGPRNFVLLGHIIWTCHHFLLERGVRLEEGSATSNLPRAHTYTRKSHQRTRKP